MRYFMAQDELKNKDCGENNIAQQQQPAVSGGAAVQKAPLSKEEKIKRILLIVLSSIVLLVIIGGFIFGSPYSIKKNSVSSFADLDFSKPTVLYCTKPSCSYCKDVTPQISQVKDQYGDKVNFYCIDVLDNKEGTEIWKIYQPGGIEAGKTGVPTVIYFYASQDPNQDWKQLEVYAKVKNYNPRTTNNYEDIKKRVEKLIANPYGNN